MEQPWISLDAKWQPLPNPDLGRFRSSTKGHVFHQSRGINGTGYALCLECGRAEPMHVDSDLPEKLDKPHRKLRRSKEEGKFCPGSDDPWKIKRGITLGHETWTDACEIQIKSEKGLWLDDRKAAITLSVALRDALAELIGVESTELDCDIKPVRTEGGDECISILLFDRNAAGYASGIGGFIKPLFSKARDHLLCPANCDSVCPRCVLDFDQRFAADHMDRNRALDVLDATWVNALQLPDKYAFFGAQSMLEYVPLIESLWQKVGDGDLSGLRLFTAGDPAQWDIGPSPLRKLAYQLAARGVSVCIVIPARWIEQLEKSESHLLAAMTATPNLTIGSSKAEPRCGDGWLLAEAFGHRPVSWASATEDTLAFGTDWGQVQDVLVKAPGVADPSATIDELVAEDLRPAPLVQGDLEIEIRNELNGNVKDFGSRFWEYLLSRHEPTRHLLQSHAGIIAIRYQDRYLFSPLSVRILYEIVRSLRASVGEDRWSDGIIDIDTLACRPRDGYRSRPRKFLWSDWDDSDMRATVLDKAFAKLHMGVRIHLPKDRPAAHARSLVIDFGSGERLIIRFDQGVSYWRASASTPYRNRLFDFALPDASTQMRTLMNSDVRLEGSDLPTQLFLKVTQQSNRTADSRQQQSADRF